MRLPQSSINRLFSTVLVAMFLTLAMISPTTATVTQQLICSPTLLKFGTVAEGQSETQLAVLTNAGQSTVTVSSVSVNDAEFSVTGLSLPQTLSPGQTVTFNVTFAPTSGGWSGSLITFGSNASNPSLLLQVGGTGVTSEAITASPSSLSFGQVAVGSASTISVMLTNARSWKDTLNSLQVTGTGYSVTGPTFPLTLAPGQSTTVKVMFTPQTAGIIGGSVFINGPSLNIPLVGTGASSAAGQLKVSPTALNFGSVIVGETGTQTTTLSASGGNVAVSSAASSNSQYALAGASFPLNIAAGQSVNMNVVFAPQTAGNSSATISFMSNASNSLAQEALAGTATAPYVSLSWAPSTSQVLGYNVYRGTTPGTYSKINTAVDPNTTYTDNNVSPGVTYYYAATAVNSSGQESPYSTALQVIVP